MKFTKNSGSPHVLTVQVYVPTFCPKAFKPYSATILESFKTFDEISNFVFHIRDSFFSFNSVEGGKSDPCVPAEGRVDPCGLDACAGMDRRDENTSGQQIASGQQTPSTKDLRPKDDDGLEEMQSFERRQAQAGLCREAVFRLFAKRCGVPTTPPVDQSSIHSNPAAQILRGHGPSVERSCGSSPAGSVPSTELEPLPATVPEQLADKWRLRQERKVQKLER
jgi:hypothetical protein